MSERRQQIAFSKMDVNLDSNPKIIRGGRNCREVFLFVLRRHNAVGNGAGGLSAANVDPVYMARQLMMTESEAKEGLDAAVRVGLLALVRTCPDTNGEPDLVLICGMDDEWSKSPMTEAERKRLQRARDKTDTSANVRTVSGHNVTSPDSHAVEKSREEERREEIPPYPPSGGSSGLGSSRKRKPRPSDPTELERSAAIEVLEALSRYSGVAYRGSENHVLLIVRQLRAGRTGLDLRKVAWYCAVKREWKDDEKMRDYLRPETLFGPKNIDKYLDAALTRYREEYKTDDDVRQRGPPQSGELRVVRDGDFETGDAA